MADDFASLLRQTSENLGINPSDLGTAMSYETGGTLDPNMRGGQNNQHLGLIQFGPEEQKKYGVVPGMPLDQHFAAVENYLRDRGVKPGMGLLDVYSAINAGRPGLYDRSDAANGGAPGTVADKVATQMVGHRAKADALLAANPASAPIAAPPAAAPMNINPPVQQQQQDAVGAPAAAGGGFDGEKLTAALMKMQQQRQQPQQSDPGMQLSVAQPAGNPASRLLAAAMSRIGSSLG